MGRVNTKHQILTMEARARLLGQIYHIILMDVGASDAPVSPEGHLAPGVDAETPEVPEAAADDTGDVLSAEEVEPPVRRAA